ncbi:MAG: DUF2255 family protein [Thermoleophilaceae bacterium]|nr:DUF2255 family protein [Thermoleophilaceae bacterium]
MDWSGALKTLGSAEEIEIETRRAADAPVHHTTVWPVVEEEEVYVRSLRGDSGRWYQDISANPDVVVHLDDEEIPVRAFLAPDAQSVERASDGLRSQYTDSPHLDSMLRDEILHTTVRLEPR